MDMILLVPMLVVGGFVVMAAGFIWMVMARSKGVRGAALAGPIALICLGFVMFGVISIAGGIRDTSLVASDQAR